MPNCNKELVVESDGDDPSIIAEIAHIKGEKPGSARYDEKMRDEERNSYDNLIVLCHNCHKLVDDQPKVYTVDRLHQIKTDHENRVRESLKSAIISVTFSELEVITSYLASERIGDEPSYDIIPIEEKMKKNELTDASRDLIVMGIMQTREVERYLTKHPDSLFGERLKSKFVAVYEKLRGEEGLRGDNLFMGLFQFATNGRIKYREQAAALSVLVYLFEKCEVFEK